jgi:hypothetical protein
VVSKPFRIPELILKVEELMERKKLSPPKKEGELDKIS